MGLLRCLAAFLTLTSLCCGAASPPQHIHYLIHLGQVDEALEAYDAWYQVSQGHDYETLERLGLSLLEQGWHSKDPETKLMALFGAGVSTHDKAIPILAEGMESSIPQLQLVSLNFLSRQQSDEADLAIHKGLASPFLPIRLEAAFHLAQKKEKKAIDHVETLMAKTPPEIREIYPKIFASAGTPDAIKMLRKLMNDPSEKVRIEAIRSVAEYQRDDLSPKIRSLASQHNVLQQEACAIALAQLHDEKSAPQLKRLAASNNENVQIAASFALATLGYREHIATLEKHAHEGNVYAITALGQFDECQKTLETLLQSPNLQTRVNAAVALLEQRSLHCMPALPEILVRDARDLAFIPCSSPSGSMTAWKVQTSSQHYLKTSPVPYELSIVMREKVLAKAIELPHQAFLKIAELIFETQQNDLVPTTVALLENLQTQEAIQLLKKYQQQVGAPFTRVYATLALYRLRAEGDYEKELFKWITSKRHIDLIRFRPLVPQEYRKFKSPYELTPEETSRLYIDTMETFAKGQDDQGLFVILNAIKSGNSKNKYALAGLLIRTNQ